MYKLAARWGDLWGVASYASERERRIVMENLRKTAENAHDGQFDTYRLRLEIQDPRPNQTGYITVDWYITGQALLNGTVIVFTLPDTG